MSGKGSPFSGDRFVDACLYSATRLVLVLPSAMPHAPDESFSQPGLISSVFGFFSREVENFVANATGTAGSTEVRPAVSVGLARTSC